MLPEEFINTAVVLNAQIKEGVINVPSITSFLSKISKVNGNQGIRKSKKQTEAEAIARKLAQMKSRKKPIIKSL